MTHAIPAVCFFTRTTTTVTSAGATCSLNQRMEFGNMLSMHQHHYTIDIPVFVNKFVTKGEVLHHPYNYVVFSPGFY